MPTLPAGFDRRADEVGNASGDESTRALELLQTQINQHREQEKLQSYLGTVIDAVWRQDDRSLKVLETLQQDVRQKAKAGDAAGIATMENEIREQIRQDKDALSWQSEINHYGAGFLKTAALFAGGKIGLAGTVALYALDQMRPADDMRSQVADMALGGLKGGLLRGTLNALGRSELGVAYKGVALGIGSRVLDLGLTRQTYLRAGTGEFNLGTGLKNTLLGTLDKKAIVADAAIFTVAHGLTSGVNRLTGDAIKRSPFLFTTLTGATFGLSSGAGTEIMRQARSGEDFSASKVVARSLIQGVLDGLAATPGGLQASRFAEQQRQAAATQWQRVLDQMGSQTSLVEGKGAEVARVPADSSLRTAVTEKTGAKDGVMPADRAAGQAEQSGSTLGAGSRVISQPDGSVVTIRPNGDVVMAKDGITTTRRKSDGMVIVENSEEKVVNVASMSVEPSARLLSNLAHTPFVLDGVRYESVEAFYQMLRITDPVRRAAVAGLYGQEAKAAGNDFKNVTTGQYRGEAFELGSPRHHEIVKMAIKAKLDQNPDVAAAIMATYPRPIIHNTGRPESKSTKYPGAVFTQTLTELRQELVDKAKTAQEIADALKQPG